MNGQTWETPRGWSDGHTAECRAHTNTVVGDGSSLRWRRAMPLVAPPWMLPQAAAAAAAALWRTQCRSCRMAAGGIFWLYCSLTQAAIVVRLAVSDVQLYSAADVRWRATRDRGQRVERRQRPASARRCRLHDECTARRLSYIRRLTVVDK